MSFLKATDSLQNIVNKVFGTSITYTSTFDGSETEIKGVFDNAYVEIQGVNTLKPILKIKLSDLPNEPLEGDFVRINGTTYSLLDGQPDGHGSATLILQKA